MRVSSDSTPGLRALLSLVFVLTWAISSFGQQDCPTLYVECASAPDTCCKSQREYVAHLGEKKPPGWSYKWTVSSGIIVHGQGTATIKVDSPEFETVTATVEIVGPKPECPRTASFTQSCHPPGFFRPPGQESKQNSSTRPRQVNSNTRFTSGRSALDIPLEIDNNIILLKVSVNGSQPMRFIFDTAASHSVLHSRRAAELGLKPEEEVSGLATGGKIEGSLTSGVSLKVGGAEVSNQQIALLDFPVPPGFDFDGIIGYDFISAFVVEIDYLKKTLNLYDPPTYRYRGTGEIVPLTIAGRRIPLVNTTIIFKEGPSVEASLAVDTGADRAIIFSSSFVTREKLVTRIMGTTEGAGTGAGGEQKILVGKIKAARLGKFLFANPPVGLVLNDDGKEGDGVIGGEIFRRFKVIIDYSRQRMIFEPNKDLNGPYSVEPGE